MTKICSADALGTVYIRADGSIDPPTAPISTLDNVTYTFTGDIFNDSIVIERDNIVIDGKGFTLNGARSTLRGVSLNSRSNITVENLEITGFTFCIWVDESSNVVIYRNNVLIQEPSPSLYPSGIYLGMSSNSSIIENQVSVTDSNDIRGIFGIYLEHSSNNTLIENNVTHNARINSLSGIGIFYSSHNLMQNNSVISNSNYLTVTGDSYEDFVNDIDSSNTVGGKPVYYWIEEENRTVPTNAGYVALINCSNIKAENLTISHSYPAITLVNTYNTTIAKSHIEKSAIGIMLLGAYNNSIIQNDLVGNSNGIYLINFGSENTSNNIVVGNNITMNDFGVWNEGSSGNTFYHNNFINNSWTHVRLLSNIREIWDNGFEGNYWSDYNGSDSNQDGIGDTPYVINANNTDHYPLMGTFQSFNVYFYSYKEVDIVSNSIIKLAQMVGLSLEIDPIPWEIVLDANGQNGTNGFCRITFPNSLLNSSVYPVYVGDDVVTSRIVESNGTYTTLYFTYNQTLSDYEIQILPEFPTFLVLPLFIVATLLAIVFYKRRRLT